MLRSHWRSVYGFFTHYPSLTLLPAFTLVPLTTPYYPRCRYWFPVYLCNPTPVPVTPPPLGFLPGLLILPVTHDRRLPPGLNVGSFGPFIADCMLPDASSLDGTLRPPRWVLAYCRIPTSYGCRVRATTLVTPYPARPVSPDPQPAFTGALLGRFALTLRYYAPHPPPRYPSPPRLPPSIRCDVCLPPPPPPGYDRFWFACTCGSPYPERLHTPPPPHPFPARAPYAAAAPFTGVADPLLDFILDARGLPRLDDVI